MIVVRFGEQVPLKPGLSSFLMYLLNQKYILMADIKNIDIEIKKAKNLKPKNAIVLRTTTIRFRNVRFN